MKEMLRLLPILAVAIAMNIAAGTYHNVGQKGFRFNWERLLTGILKAAIVSALFIGTAFCFEMTDLSSIGADPKFIMNAAISLYVGKALISLGRILGVDSVKANHL